MDAQGSDFEVKLKMDGGLRRFADEANSIDDAILSERVLLSRHEQRGTTLPPFLPKIAISHSRAERRVGSRDLTCLYSRVLVNPCPLDTQSLLISGSGYCSCQTCFSLPALWLRLGGIRGIGGC